MFFLTMACELTALTTADSSLVSLLENCAIIFVPVLEAVILRRMPGKTTVRCAALAMLGVVCLALRHGALSGGVVFGLMAALCYAGAILVTHRVSRQAKDNLAVGILQIGTMGVLSLCAALLLEDKPQPMSGEQWAMMAALIIICTGFGFTLQPVAQSRVSAERAGLFCAVSPAVATLLGVVVLGEKIGLLSIAGLLLILTAILLPHLETRKT
jgi:drug/metabolite transporter (DMT)-like permease